MSQNKRENFVKNNLSDKMGVNTMTDKEQITTLVDIYTDLLRIKKAKDMEDVTAEVDNQLRKAKVKLEALGIVTEDLVIK